MSGGLLGSELIRPPASEFFIVNKQQEIFVWGHVTN